MTKTLDITARSKLLRKFEHDETRSQRAFAAQRVEMRADPGTPDLLTFVGYASVTDTPYDIYGGPGAGGWAETVVSGAFAKTLASNPDVAFLINHTGMTLARTKSGTLSLAEDAQGLAVEASLHSGQGPVRDLQIAMDRRDIDEMSFAFRIIRDKWLTADGEEVPWWDMSGIDRRILEVSIQKGDVSVVNYGANPHTSSDLRALFAEARAGRGLSPQARELVLLALGVEDDVPAPQPVASVPPAPQAGMSLSLARALAGT